MIESDTFAGSFSAHKPSMKYMYALTILSCIGGFLFGYDTGIISGALIYIQEDFNLDSFSQELVVGITVAGALIASIFSGSISDYFGRKNVILASSLIFLLGAIMMAFAQQLVGLLCGRFVVGLGVGMASFSMPIYVSEASPAESRGFLVTCINVAITFGQFFSSIVAGTLSDTSGGWRYMLGFAGLPALIQFIGFLYLPESPRWLIENKKIDLAISALQRLRDVDV